MSNDPASLEASITLSGLDRSEAAVFLHALPSGCSATFEITQPALGGARVRATAGTISLIAARGVLDAVIGHHEGLQADDYFGVSGTGDQP